MSNVEHSIIRQTEAAKQLLASLKADGSAEDAELVSDMIEGETGLSEAITAALNELDECDVIIVGAKAKEEEFASRRRSAEKRAERIRGLIEQAMIMTEQTALRLPVATLSLARRAPGLILTNEADIPVKYWIEQERPAPKLDKKALLSDLNNNEPVPGATLDNGSYSLTLRRK